MNFNNITNIRNYTIYGPYIKTKKLGHPFTDRRVRISPNIGLKFPGIFLDFKETNELTLGE